MFKKLETMKVRHQYLTNQLKDLSKNLSLEKKQEMLKEYSYLSKILKPYDEYNMLQKSILDCKKIAESKTEDKELIALALQEMEQLKAQEQEILQQLKKSLLPVDSLDKKNIIMEFRQGAGGHEAALFCEELFTLYAHFAQKNSWVLEILSSSSGGSGGFRELICSLSGSCVYSHLKYESGVHRVQRVPRTESQGRVHTSTVTLVVLPLVGEKEVLVKPSDIRVDTFRSSGAGGQHVNTTDSAVRIVHLPTKITVQCQDEKSQHANKEKAMKVLYARIYDQQIKQQKDKESKLRLGQMGTGDRSEKVRTYNFPQNRVTDHRTNLTIHHISEIMKGNIEGFIEALKLQHAENWLAIN